MLCPGGVDTLLLPWHHPQGDNIISYIRGNARVSGVGFIIAMTRGGGG
jgi:hypothetical protein